MNTKTIKRAVLSVALSAALVATVSGATYGQKAVAAESVHNETACYQVEAKLNTNQRYANISEINQEYVSSPIETFVSSAVDEPIETIDFTYNDLYSINNEIYGYVLDYSCSRGDGFLIVSEIEDSETIIEMDLSHSSPYSGKDGKYIYVSFDKYYIEYSNGKTVRLALDGEEFDANPSTGPLKSSLKQGIPHTETNSYTMGLLFEKEIPNFYYKYTTSLSAKSNNCANAAGVIALNFWNNYHANGLLKLSSSQLISGSYNMNNPTATQYMDTFYSYMKTNKFWGYGGTLPSDCFDGFTKMITENGYVARKDTVTTFEDIKYQINRGVPVFIVSQDYYFTYRYSDRSAIPLPTVSSTQGDYTLTIDYTETYGLVNAHTFVGFGFAEYTLYDSNGYDTKIHLVKIADGWNGERYFNFDISDTTSLGMAAIRVSRC